MAVPEHDIIDAEKSVSISVSIYNLILVCDII